MNMKNQKAQKQQRGSRGKDLFLSTHVLCLIDLISNEITKNMIAPTQIFSVSVMCEMSISIRPPHLHLVLTSDLYLDYLDNDI